MDIFNKVKQSLNWTKILEKLTCSEGLVSRIYKEYSTQYWKEKSTMKNGKNINRHFSKAINWMAKYLRKCSTSLASGKEKKITREMVRNASNMGIKKNKSTSYAWMKCHNEIILHNWYTLITSGKEPHIESLCHINTTAIVKKNWHNMDESWSHHTKWKKSARKGHIRCDVMMAFV